MTSTTVSEYTQTEQALAELRSKYAGAVFNVATTKGNEEARVARRELVTLRTGLEEKRQILKAPAIEFAKRLDAEAKRITAEIKALEEPIDAQIKAEEQRKEEIRLAKVAAEEARIKKIQAAIVEIRALPATLSIKATSADIDVVWNTLKDRELTGEVFEEFLEQAQVAKTEVLAQLNQTYEQAVEKEAEARKLAAERAELERQRAELDEQRKAEELRKTLAAAAEKAQRDAEAAELKRQQDELKRQQDQLAAAKRAQDEEAARLVRERQADEKRRRDEEAQRLEDARKMQEGIDRAAREKREAEAQAEQEAAEKRKAAAARLIRASQRPKAVEVIDLIAREYDIHPDDARSWLIDLGTEAELLGVLAKGV